MVFGGTHGIGQPGWYYYNVNDRATAWNDVSTLYEFISQHWVWSAGPEGCTVTKDQAYEGDLIQYDWTNNGSWDHIVIIVDTVWIGYTYFHYVAGHTPDVYNYAYTSFDYPNKVYRFIHIERIDGYAMVYSPLAIKNGSGTTNQMPIPILPTDPYPAPIENNPPLQLPLPYPTP